MNQSKLTTKCFYFLLGYAETIFSFGSTLVSFSWTLWTRLSSVLGNLRLVSPSFLTWTLSPGHRSSESQVVLSASGGSLMDLRLSCWGNLYLDSKMKRFNSISSHPNPSTPPLMPTTFDTVCPDLCSCPELSSSSAAATWCSDDVTYITTCIICTAQRTAEAVRTAAVGWNTPTMHEDWLGASLCSAHLLVMSVYVTFMMVEGAQDLRTYRNSFAQLNTFNLHLGANHRIFTVYRYRN